MSKTFFYYVLNVTRNELKRENHKISCVAYTITHKISSLGYRYEFLEVVYYNKMSYIQDTLVFPRSRLSCLWKRIQQIHYCDKDTVFAIPQGYSQKAAMTEINDNSWYEFYLYECLYKIKSEETMYITPFLISSDETSLSDSE